MRSSLRRAGPPLLGVLLIGHGLGHAVLPLRGAGLLGGDAWFNGLAMVCSLAAIVGFVAAGAGLLGVRPFDRAAFWLTLGAATGSLVALRMLGDTDLWPGMLLDVGLTLAVALADVRFARARQPVRQAAGTLLVLWVGTNALLWPWHRSWGTTAEERAMTLPGDPAYRAVALERMHGVGIDAPPERVWPWLVQIGQDRAGFYSYDWLERAFLVDIRNADVIRADWQPLKAGDFVRATQPDYLGGLLGDHLGWYVSDLQPGRALVLEGWGAFVLRDDGRGGTRLYVRSTFAGRHIPVWAAALSFTTFELPHFIMQRRMLLGIKERSERGTS